MQSGKEINNSGLWINIESKQNSIQEVNNCGGTYQWENVQNKFEDEFNFFLQPILDNMHIKGSLQTNGKIKNFCAKISIWHGFSIS